MNAEQTVRERKFAKRAIVAMAMSCLFVPLAELHAQGVLPGDAPEQVAVHDQTDLTFRYAPPADYAGNARVQRRFSLGAMQDVADASSDKSSAASNDLWARGNIELVPSVNSADLLPYSYTQEESPIAKPDDWQFKFLAHGWLPLRIKGDVTTGSNITSLDITLSDILDDLKMVAEGGFELSNDEWSFLVWGVYFNIASDVNTRVGPANFDTAIGFEATIVDMALAYRVGDWALGDSKTANFSLDLLAGIMVWDIEIDIHERGPLGFDPMVREVDAWVDGIIGGRFVFDLSEKFSAEFRGDVGGFGIGSGSDLTWNITLMGEYKLSPTMSLAFGYRYLDVDWSKGSGSSKLEYDLAIHGPIMGVTIEF